MPKIVLTPIAPEEYFREFPEFPREIVQLLYNRKLLTQKDVDSFLNPEYHELHDPYLFNDMRKACDRIYRSIESGEIIAIHGDYDADGVSGSVILYSILNELGAKTVVFLPHREKDGYGLNPHTIDYLDQQKARLIITVDCGISSAAEIAQASARGIDTIVTDHHQIPEIVPHAHAIIHPLIADEHYPFKYLAGGGVAFKLMQGLLRDERCTLSSNDKEAFEKWLLDMVALSSVADMVVLTGENRILVKYGILVMAHNKRLGLQKLFGLGSIVPRTITTQTIGFRIAPRINAAGRMDHANTAYMLLTATVEAEAERLALLLEQQNKERQTVTEHMFKQSLEFAHGQTDNVIIVYNKTWPAGLTGLLAGRLSKKLHKPVFALGFDGTRVAGSGRSPNGVKVMEGLLASKDLLASFGGHPQACGFRLPPENVDELTRQLRSYFNTKLTKESLVPVVAAECAINFDSISWTLLDYLQRFEPYGQGNQQPYFYTQNVEVVTARAVGKKLNHGKLILQQKNKALPGIAFDTDISQLKPHENLDIVFTLDVNEWNGNREMQLTIKHMMPHER